jgi:uncharacterized protein YjbI with pentapeptide repeats
MTVLLGAAVAAALTFFLTWLVLKIPPTGRLPAPGPDGTSPFLDVLKVALTVSAGIGGAVALVVAYRRQRHLEVDDAGRRSRYTSASQQLGDPQAAVRLAGVYAMANLADEWAEQRQQCVDVLCAYLRLPWAGNPTQVEPNTTTTEHTWPDGLGQRKVTRTYSGRAGEREVRQTLVRVIASHLRPGTRSTAGSAISWSDLDIDLTNAAMPNADFTCANFRGRTSFNGAAFSGSSYFDSAQFSNYAHFDGAKFSDIASFSEARFSGGASFAEAQFSDLAIFPAAQFSAIATFHGTRFSDVALFDTAQFFGEASFSKARFSGDANFGKVEFSGEADFSEAKFSGRPSFSKAQFSGDANLGKVEFSGDAHFSEAKFSGRAYFSEAKFSGRAFFLEARFPGRADFGKAEFSTALFADAVFSGGAYFGEAEFSDTAAFLRARFFCDAYFGDAYFGDAEFPHPAEFHEAEFSRDANLARASLPSRSVFASALVPPSENALKRALFRDEQPEQAATSTS